MALGCFGRRLGLCAAVYRRQGRDHGCNRLGVAHDGERTQLPGIRGENSVELLCSKCSRQSRGERRPGMWLRGCWREGEIAMGCCGDAGEPGVCSRERGGLDELLSIQGRRKGRTGLPRGCRRCAALLLARLWMKRRDEMASLNHQIFLTTAHPRRSCPQSRLLFFTVLDDTSCMALIPLARTRGKIQKTSLLGRVAQILINPRPSPCLADVGLFVRLKSQQLYVSQVCISIRNLFQHLFSDRLCIIVDYIHQHGFSSLNPLNLR